MQIWFTFGTCMVLSNAGLEKRLTRVGESITESNPRCHCYREQAGHVLPIASEKFGETCLGRRRSCFGNSIKRRGRFPFNSIVDDHASSCRRTIDPIREIFSQIIATMFRRDRVTGCTAPSPRDKSTMMIQLRNHAIVVKFTRTTFDKVLFTLSMYLVRFEKKKKKSSANCVSCNLTRVYFLIIATSFFTRFELERGSIDGRVSRVLLP